LAARVLAVVVLVVLTGNLTAWLVASAVAPSIFTAHMHQAGMAQHAEATVHAQQAFESASGISLTVALLAALAVSVAVTGYLTRRLVRSLQPLVRAAADVAAGHYEIALDRPGLGEEFDELTDAFNRMAGQLHQVEDTRRRLLADLAHEVRTPVATLRAYVEALEDGVASLDGEAFAVLHAQVSRLSRLAEDVAALSRAEEAHQSLRCQVIKAEVLVTLAGSAAADRYAAAGVRLVQRCAPGLPGVRVDPDRIGQVLGNVLDNALRYTPSGGSVTVAADHRADGVRLSITDTGEGIAAEHLPHLFERFYRADAARDRAHGGSGIGLAIVKALVEAHGGRVAVTSPGPGQGTTVTLDLPAAEPAQSANPRPFASPR
jgi:signal transduction histidine kinase